MIQKLQNNTVRSVTGNFNYINYRGIDIVKELRCQTCDVSHHYYTANLVFKCIKGYVLSYLENIFTNVSTINCYDLTLLRCR